MSQQSGLSAFRQFGTPNKCTFVVPRPGSIVINDPRQQKLFDLRISGSYVHPRGELVDVNMTTPLKFKINIPTGNCTAYGSRGDVLFSIDNTGLFSRGTPIDLDCAQGVFYSKDLLLNEVLVSEDVSLAVESQGSRGRTEEITARVTQLIAEYVRFTNRDINDMHLATEPARLIAKGARVTSEAANVAHMTAEGHALIIAVTHLNAEGVRLKAMVARLNALAAEGAPPTSEGAHPNMGTGLSTLAVKGSLLNDIANRERGVPERHDAADLKFQFRGSWTGKACALYIADTEIKIAQMRPLDNSNANGFSLDILPNVNCEFVIASFAAVMVMKMVARKQKELLSDAFCSLGRCLCGFAGNVAGGSAIELVGNEVGGSIDEL